MLTLPNMVLAIPVWYLHPPEMVPRPSLPPQKEGIPMTIPILTPTTPPLTNPPATAGGRRKKKEPTAPLPPRIPPPCALCEKEGHQTNNCPSLPELRNLIPLNHSPTPTTTASPATTTPPSSSKGLRTKYACAICSEYGHYTHHCPALPRFRQTLAAVRQNFQSNPSPATSSSTNITDIRYVTTSVNERMRCPCSLCDSLAHFTYQCPMILEYRQRQLTLLHQPAEAIIDITSSLEDLHVISPEPEALPTPPWFLDDLSEDSPPNPPNSPAHSPMDILHPTTTGTPQYFNIWFMSSEPSPSPNNVPPASSPGGNHTTTITEITPHDPLYSRHFQCDEEILEELNHPDSPWDALHHRALFSPQEASMPPNQNPIYAVETKDFIPQGLSTGSKIPFLPLMLLKKETWPTFPPPLKSTFPLKMASSKKSPLELLALLRKSPHIKPSSRNIGIFLPGHTRKCLASIPLLSNIASTPGLTLHQFTKNNDRYTHPKPRLSKPKLTNYALSGSFTPSPIPHGFPTLYPLTKNRALSVFAQTFAISITHVPKTTFQCLSSIKLSTTAPATRLSPLWTDSLVIIKFKSTRRSV
jgi:hypothetical protein